MGAMLPGMIWKFLFPGQAKPRRIFQELAQSPFIIEEIDRKKTLDNEPWLPHLKAPLKHFPKLDISIVTYNSQKWIPVFFQSLLNQNYPKEKITLLITDNDSSDGTFTLLERCRDMYRGVIDDIRIFRRRNLGFGCGHNSNLKYATSDYVLVANIDIEFESDTLSVCLASALTDSPDVAAWECRQKPYEQNKYYDYLTLETAWVSGGCVLFRRRALADINGFDPSIFMYCEDVEVSYRLRSLGWHLRYLPWAVVWHYAYEKPGQVKPLQYAGSIFGNIYLRLKYGDFWQISAIPVLVLQQLLSHQPIRRHRRIVIDQLVNNVGTIPKSLLNRNKGARKFGFLGWEFEKIRAGRFHTLHPLPASPPTVMVILRHGKHHMHWLRESLYSILNQTYTRIKLVIIEAIHTDMVNAVEGLGSQTGWDISVLNLNTCETEKDLYSNLLTAYDFEFIQLIDTSQAIFADHIEVLVQTLMEHPGRNTVRAMYWVFNTPFSYIDSQKYVNRIDSAQSKSSTPLSLNSPQCFTKIPFCSLMFHRNSFLNESAEILKSFLIDEESTMPSDSFSLRHIEPIAKTTSIHKAVIG